MDNFEHFVNTENTSSSINSQIKNEISQHREMNSIADHFISKSKDHYNLSTSLTNLPNMSNYINEFNDLREVEMSNYCNDVIDEDDSDDCVITGTSQEAPFKMPAQSEVPLSNPNIQNFTINQSPESSYQNESRIPPQAYIQPSFPTYNSDNYGCWTMPQNELPGPPSYRQLAPAPNNVHPNIENTNYIIDNHGTNMGYMSSNVLIGSNEGDMVDHTMNSFDETTISAPFWDIPSYVDNTIPTTPVSQSLHRNDGTSILSKRNLMRNERRKKQRLENRTRNMNAVENTNNTVRRNEVLTGLTWRIGPASFWYDFYNVPQSENVLNYRIKLSSIDDDVQSLSMIRTESFQDEDCCFSTWQLINWEDDVIIDAEAVKSQILESNYKFACHAGWIPSDNNRTMAAFQEAACVDHAGIWPASSTGTLLPQPDVTQWHSIFSVENAQITESDWVSKIIIDPRHQNAQDPYLLELDLNNESIHFDFTNPHQTREILISELNSVYLTSSDSSHQLNEQNNDDENPDTKVALTPVVACSTNKETELKKMKILSKFVDVSETTEKPKESRLDLIESESISLVVYSNRDVYTVVHEPQTDNPFSLDPIDSEKVDKSDTILPLQRYGIQHSMAATQLDSLFFPLKLDNQFLRHFHRPRLTDVQRPTLPMFLTPQPIYNPTELLKTESEQRQKICQLTGDGDLFFMRSIADLSACTDHIVLAEYSEEFPPLMMQIGMASRIINHFKERSRKSSVVPNLSYGELSLSPQIPFLGQLSSNQVLQALENNMFRAPLYPHKVQSTDFLVIIKSSTIIIRRVDDIFVVGQQLPLALVPTPNSRKAITFSKNFFQVQTIRLFLQSKDEPKRIRHEDVKATFLSQTDAELKRHLRIFAEYKKTECGWFWFLKPQFLLPSEDDLVELIGPEECCAYYSMMWGLCRLEDAGYNSKSFLQPDPDQHNEEEDRESSLKIEEEVRAAPWHTTKTFLDAQRNKCFMELIGSTEPTGCGEAFSYARVNGKNALFKETLKARSNKLSSLFRTQIQTIGKKLITGTDADLRRLTFKKAYNLLKGCGIVGRDIKKLRRWDLIDLVRQMSTSKASRGGNEEAIVKFARSAKTSTVGNEEKYRTECQRIFSLQNQVLSNEDQLTTDDEESDDDDEVATLEPANEVAQRRLANGAAEEELELRRIKRALEGWPSREPVCGALFLAGKEARCVASADNAQAILKLKSPLPKALCIRRQIEDSSGSMTTHCQTIPWSSIVKIYFKMNQEHKKDYLMNFCGLNQASKEEKKALRRQQEKIRRLKLQNKKKVQKKFGHMAKKYGQKQAVLVSDSAQQLVCSACGKPGHMRSNKVCLLYTKTGKRGRPPLARPPLARPAIRPTCQPIRPVQRSVTTVVPVERVAEPSSGLCQPLPHLDNMSAYQLLDLLDPQVDTPDCTQQTPYIMVQSDQAPPPQCRPLSADIQPLLPPEPTESDDPISTLRPSLSESRQSSFDFLAEQLVPRSKPLIVPPAIPKPTIAKNGRPSTASLTLSDPDYCHRLCTKEDLEFLPSKHNLTLTKKKPLQKSLNRLSSVTVKHVDYVVDQNMRGNRRRIDPRVALNHQFEEIYKGLLQVEGYRCFLHPVRKRDYPSYYSIIENPMDLSMVKMKINKDSYETRERFIQDIKLIYDNCIKFNGEDSEYTTIAKHFMSHVMEQFCVKERKLMRLERLVNPLMDDDDMVGMRYVLDRTVTAMEEVEDSRQFQSAVDKKKWPDYADIVTRPMNLDSLRKNIKADKYRSREDFLTDANLMLSNAILYFGEENGVTNVCRSLIEAANKFFHEKEATFHTLEMNLRIQIDNASDSLVNGHLSTTGDDHNEDTSVDTDPPSNRMQRVSESGEEEKAVPVLKAVSIDTNRKRIMADLQLTDSEDEDSGKKVSANGSMVDTMENQLQDDTIEDDGPTPKKRKMGTYFDEDEKFPISTTASIGDGRERIMIDLQLTDSDDDEMNFKNERSGDDACRNEPSEILDKSSSLFGGTSMDILSDRCAISDSGNIKIENGNASESQLTIPVHGCLLNEVTIDDCGPTTKKRKMTDVFDDEEKYSISKVVSSESERERNVIDLKLIDREDDGVNLENGRSVDVACCNRPTEVLDKTSLLGGTSMETVHHLLSDRCAISDYGNVKMENGNVTGSHVKIHVNGCLLNKNTIDDDGSTEKKRNTGEKTYPISKVISSESEDERIVIDLQLTDSEDDGMNLENGHAIMCSRDDACYSGSSEVLDKSSHHQLHNEKCEISDSGYMKMENVNTSETKVTIPVNGCLSDEITIEDDGPTRKRRKMAIVFAKEEKYPISKVVSSESERERIVIDLQLSDSEDDIPEHDKDDICHMTGINGPLELVDNSFPFKDMSIEPVMRLHNKIVSISDDLFVNMKVESGNVTENPVRVSRSNVVPSETEKDRIVIDLQLSDSDDDCHVQGMNVENGHVGKKRPLELVDNSFPFKDTSIEPTMRLCDVREVVFQKVENHDGGTHILGDSPYPIEQGVLSKDKKERIVIDLQLTDSEDDNNDEDVINISESDDPVSCHIKTNIPDNPPPFVDKSNNNQNEAETGDSPGHVTFYISDDD